MEVRHAEVFIIYFSVSIQTLGTVFIV